VLNRLFFVAIFFCSFNLSAQEDSLRNELKINGFNMVLGMPEITYERVFNDNKAFGVSVLIGVDRYTELKYALMPYYRKYFKDKYANAIFIEASTGVLSVNDTRYNYSRSGKLISIDDHFTTIGLGVSAGYKFFTKNKKLFGEAYIGLGRLFKENKLLSNEYPRIGVVLGSKY
jgi:hypothetical protein